MNSDKKHNALKTIITNVAVENGQAAVFVAGENSEVLLEANNNSICEFLYNSAEFAPRCAEFCGRAYKTATAAGKSVAVKCHAGLYYETTPVALNRDENAAVIVGRGFLDFEDYKSAAERGAEGDWAQFPAEEFFANVLFETSDAAVKKVAARLTKLSDEEKSELLALKRKKIPVRETQTQTSILESEEISKLVEQFRRNKNAQSGKSANVRISGKPPVNWSERRAFFNSLVGLSYKNAMAAVLDFLKRHYETTDIAWLEKSEDHLEIVTASGTFASSPFNLKISLEDPRLLETVEKETALAFREQQKEGQENVGKIYLFPLSAGGKVEGGIVVGDQAAQSRIKQIAGFLHAVSPELEILRLREEVERQSRKTRAVQRLTEALKDVDSNGFWEKTTQISAELMRAERSSLLVLDEDSGELIVKAAVGNRADIIKRENPEVIGRRIASKVLQSGKPLLVKNLKNEGISSAPDEWRYKTDTFISYPITINSRKVGVLNVSDTVDGSAYDESDLKLLETLSPQIALALDRISLQRKAGAFEQLSITDALTGLVNRRYLEERLAEEINRSKRYGYPLSFLMIDVDEFKSYNDTFTHPEGDKALQIVGQCLKSGLRAADVAARYGGEEFSILLPQTNSEEAETIAERIRQKVETTKFPNRQVTISIGIASCEKSRCSAEELISLADKALYKAKKLGRNNSQTSICTSHF